MEPMHTENQAAADVDSGEAPRKAWHAPSVRWLDVHERTQLGVAGASDGGSSGNSIS